MADQMIGSNKPALPPDLQTILDDLGIADEDARRLIDGLTSEQVNWQPDANSWSVAQCLDHLIRANTIYVAALREAVRKTGAEEVQRRGPIRPGLPSRLFIGWLEPPSRVKGRAPKAIVPASHGNPAEVLRRFLLAQEEVRTLVLESAGLELNRIRFRNPFARFLCFTVGAGLLIITAHDRRHLRQAEKVRHSAGFPSN
jgi:hypothetical protein